jgi:hypothetical protein
LKHVLQAAASIHGLDYNKTPNREQCHQLWIIGFFYQRSCLHDCWVLPSLSLLLLLLCLLIIFFLFLQGLQAIRHRKSKASFLDLSDHPKPATDYHLKTGQRE